MMLQALQRHIQRYPVNEPGAEGTGTGKAGIWEPGACREPGVCEETRTGQALSLQAAKRCWIIMILLCALLAGCGSYVPGQGGQSQATPTATPTLTPSPTHGQQAQICGEVDTTLTGKALDASKAKNASNCFWQAYQSCQAASLTLKVHSLDTGANHVFAIKNSNGKCSITDTVTHYIVPNNLNTTRSYSCTGLVQQADGLHFIDCGSIGNIVVPR